MRINYKVSSHFIEEPPWRLTHLSVNPGCLRNTTTASEFRFLLQYWPRTILQKRIQLIVLMYTIIQKSLKLMRSSNHLQNDLGNPNWETGAALLLRPLPGDVFREGLGVQAVPKLGSSSKDYFYGVSGGQTTSNLRFSFTGLHVTFLLPLLGEGWSLQDPGRLRVGPLTGT